MTSSIRWAAFDLEIKSIEYHMYRLWFGPIHHHQCPVNDGWPAARYKSVWRINMAVYCGLY